MPELSNTQLMLGASYGLIIAALIHHLADPNDQSTKIGAQEIAAQLGPWVSHWQTMTYFRESSTILGPVITARLADKFCGFNEIDLSRLPQKTRGTSGWSTLLSVVHPSLKETERSKIISSGQANSVLDGKSSWKQLPLEPLTLHDGKLCIKISRATLITLLALMNARPIFSYSSAAGYRSAYPSYCGIWNISWPNGGPCVVSLAAHDSHSSETDVYPPQFPVRVDACVKMLAGIVSDGPNWKLAFPGRAKTPGPWLLQYTKKGFPGAHGSRHLYNMMGGKVYEVDLLSLASLAKPENVEKEYLKLEIPCLAPDNSVATVFVAENEQKMLAQALDSLPWSSLSWSMHRGMKDLLLGYGKTVMDFHRVELAAFLKKAVTRHEDKLVERGWESHFVKTSMEDMVESSIMSGTGNSGDLVRIVVAIVEVLLENSYGDLDVDKDSTNFWRSSKVLGLNGGINLDMTVALTKFFVLEWSQELDYQLYHQLPLTVYLS